MKRRTWIMRTVAALAMLVGVASAQTDYRLQLVTESGSSDSGTPSVTITTGSTGGAVVNIIPLNGFNQAVSFSCVGMPANGSCTFNPTTVTPQVTSEGSQPALTSLTIQTVANATAKVSPGYRRWMLGSCFAIAGIFLVIPGARRRGLLPMLMLLTLSFLLIGTACGGGGTPSNQVQPGTYTVLVNSISGSITHSANLQLIIQKK
jgi:hypothetical protein